MLIKHAVLLAFVSLLSGSGQFPIPLAMAAGDQPAQPQSQSQLSGSLFQYHPDKLSLVAFQAARNWPANASPAGTVILISGMGEGPLTMPVVPMLNTALDTARYHLVQVVLSSSYLGFGNGMLTRDVEELDALLNKLYAMDNGHMHRNIVLMGHSTGSQISLYYARTGRFRTQIKGCILQAAVSDRDYQTAHLTNTKNAIRRAEQLRDQQLGEEMMKRADFPDAPITVNRFLALMLRNGMDDMFSTDLSDAEVKAIYSNVTVPLAMIQSGKDEYVPDQTRLAAMVQQHKRIYAKYRVSAIVPGSAHSPDTTETQRKLVDLALEALHKF